MSKINTERRKRVMSRSIKLGHCVCDPAKPCPCDLFKEKNICLCAGERLENPVGEVRLTKMVEKPGCASKIDQAFLKEVLSDLPECDDPRVLIGYAAGDDAGVYDMLNGQALVQTVDVFTPSVDDPYTFGQIAAANSVSDVYAMGGKPLTALSIIGFPVRKIPDQALNDILRGGMDKLKEAGVSVVGGHSINDDQMKAGFAVTGIIPKDKIAANSSAKEGDLLILTKPLGTGIVAFASQINRASEESLKASAESMTTLNKTAAELMMKHGARACTDVTGFSLMGHLSEMAIRSGMDVEILWDNIPWLPGVLQYVADGILPGAIERNRESCAKHVTPGMNVTREMEDMCFDAQTSGGLLIAIDPHNAPKLLAELRENGLHAATIIGSFISKGTGRVFLETSGDVMLPSPTPKEKVAAASKATETAASCCCEEIPSENQSICCQDSADTSSCCCSEPQTAEQATTAACCSETAADECCSQACCCDSPAAGSDDMLAAEKGFMGFLSSASRPGELDAVTKQIVNIALSVATRCEPCLKSHIAKARKMGLTQKEIDEAAWLGVAFAGSPAMMMYKQNRNCG